MIAVREAQQDDKHQILSFCAKTFSWGDYIDQVWDLWLEDKGRMLVAESDGKNIGLSHVAVCPDSKSTWLEGIRVHPSRRREGVATALIGEMLEYGRKKGASNALAIVARDNTASQHLMERTGFSVISEWSFYNTVGNSGWKTSGARFASLGELDAIMEYLETSAIYKNSARMYVRSWHWYPLDRLSLKDLLQENRVVVSGQPLAGIAVINNNGYWNRRNILQIVYLDSHKLHNLNDLLTFVTNMYLDGKYEHLHVICQQDKKMISALEKFEIRESEQFLLYSKVISG